MAGMVTVTTMSLLAPFHMVILDVRAILRLPFVTLMERSAMRLSSASTITLNAPCWTITDTPEATETPVNPEKEWLLVSPNA